MRATMAQRVYSWSPVRTLSAAGALLAALAAPAPAQDGKVKAPEWKHGMDLKVRLPDEKELKTAKNKYGVEVFADPNINKLVYVSQTGSIASLTASATGGDKPKDPEF